MATAYMFSSPPVMWMQPGQQGVMAQTPWTSPAAPAAATAVPTSPSAQHAVPTSGVHKAFSPVVGFSPAPPSTSWRSSQAATSPNQSHPPSAAAPWPSQQAASPRQEEQAVPPQNGNRTYAGEEVCDFYELLKVSRTASQSDIKRAYHHQAMQYHPDKNSHPRAAVIFDRIRKAYDVLKDLEMRSKYDQYGQQGVENFMAHMDRKRQTEQLEREKSAPAAPAAAAVPKPVTSSGLPSPMFARNRSRPCANSGAERDRSISMGATEPSASTRTTIPDYEKCVERIRAEERQRLEELEKSVPWERAKERLVSEWARMEDPPIKSVERESKKPDLTRDFEHISSTKSHSFSTVSTGASSVHTPKQHTPNGSFALGAEAKPQSIDVRITLPVKLEELYAGALRIVNVDVAAMCPRCLGSGGRPGVAKKSCIPCDGRGFLSSPLIKGFADALPLRRPCTACNGKGLDTTEPAFFCTFCNGLRTKTESRRLTVKVEPGMEPGRTIRLRGQGNAIPATGEQGDIVVTLEQEPHPFFARSGADLLLAEEVGLVDALCGFTLTIRHLDGRALHLKQPPGQVVKPGQVLSIAGEGMPEELHPYRFGSLLIRFEVRFPDQIGEKQMYALRSAFAPGESPPAPAAAQLPRSTLPATTRPAISGTTLDLQPWHGDPAVLAKFH
eukprot:GGOE01008063.1.p1 GENE.GGOE01008063.1~~GGOE01008063.1.p1  ORF type:complete len:683 (+),score=151.94 GGOE01008063.1:40-2049(+)